MPAVMTALFCDLRANLLVELDCTKQPGAVISALASRPIVSGAEGESPSRHNGIEPLIFAIALTLSEMGPFDNRTPVIGVYCFRTTTWTVIAVVSTLTDEVTLGSDPLMILVATAET